MITREHISDFFKDLSFDEENHAYYLNGYAIETSASKIAHSFSTPFDSETISKRLSAIKGIPKEDILKEWEDIKNSSSSEGTAAHLFAEKYIKDKNVSPTTCLDVAAKKAIDKILTTTTVVDAETRMFHKEHFYAGTADLLVYNNFSKEYILFDYKSNKDLFKRYKENVLSGPFSQMEDTPFNMYALQLSMYQTMYEQLGINISHRYIVWIKRDETYSFHKTPYINEKLIYESWRNNRPHSISLF